VEDKYCVDRSEADQSWGPLSGWEEPKDVEFMVAQLEKAKKKYAILERDGKVRIITQWFHAGSVMPVNSSVPTV